MNSKKWLVTHKLWGLTAEKSGEKGCKTYNRKFVSKAPKTELFCYFNPDACIQYSNVQNDAQINATREPDQEIFLGFCSNIGKFLPSQVPGGCWWSGIIFPILQASYIFRLVPPNQSGWLRGLLFGTRTSQISIQGWIYYRWYWFQFFTT